MRRIQHELASWTGGTGSQTSFPLVDGENYVAISTKDSLVVSDQILTVISGSRPSSDIASINQGNALAQAGLDGNDGNFVAVLCMDVDRQFVGIKDIRHGLDLQDERASNVEIFVSRRKKSCEKSAEETTSDGQTGASREEGPDEEGKETASEKFLPRGQDKDGSPDYELPEKLPPRQLRLIADGDQITFSFVFTEHTIKLQYSAKVDSDSSSTNVNDETIALKGDASLETEADKGENQGGNSSDAEMNARRSLDSAAASLPETQDNQQSDEGDDSEENGSDEELLSIGDTPAKDNQVTFEEAHAQKDSDGGPDEDEDFDHTQAFQVAPTILANKRNSKECDSTTGEESSCSEDDAGPIPEIIGLGQPETIDENNARDETNDKQPPDSATTCECSATEQETQAYPGRKKLEFDDEDQKEAGGEFDDDPTPTFGNKRTTSDSESSTTVDLTKDCDSVGDNGDAQTQAFPVTTIVKSEDVETDDDMAEAKVDVKLEDNLGTGENGMNGVGDDEQLHCETQLYDMATQSPAKEARGAVEKDEENDEEKSDRESINDDPGEVATEAPMQNEPKTIDGEGGVLGATENFAVGKRDEAVVKTKPLELENDASEVDSDDACIANKPETEDLDDEVGDVDMAQASGGEQGTDVMVQVAAGVDPPSPLTDIPRENENESDGGSAENRSKTEAGNDKSEGVSSENACDGGDGAPAQSAPSEINGDSISGQENEASLSEVDSDDACIANKPETEDLDDEVGDVDMAQASGGEQGTDVMVQVAAGVDPPSPLTDIPRENENESDGGSAENQSKTGADSSRIAGVLSEKSCDGGDGAQSASPEINGDSISGQDSEQKNSDEVRSQSRDDLEVDRKEEPDDHPNSNGNNQTGVPIQPTSDNVTDPPDPDANGENEADVESQTTTTNSKVESSAGLEVDDKKADSVSREDLSREDDNEKVATKSSPSNSSTIPSQRILPTVEPRSRADDADETKQQRQNREVHRTQTGALETEAVSEAIPLQAQPAASSQSSKQSTAKRKRTRESANKAGTGTQESRVPVKHPATKRRTSGQQGSKNNESVDDVRIMFTGIEPNSKHKKMIKAIGAHLVTSIEDAASATRKKRPATVSTLFALTWLLCVLYM